MKHPNETTQDVARAIIDHCNTIRRAWPHMLPGRPAIRPGGHYSGTGVQLDDHDQRDEDVAQIDRVISLRREVQDYLNGWCRIVFEERDLQATRLDGTDVPAMCRFLATHADWMSGQEFAADCLEELATAARRCHRVANPPTRDTMPIGECPVDIVADDDTRTACGATIRVGIDHVGDIRCPSCQTTGTFDEWVLRMVGTDGPRTAEQLIPALRRVGYAITPAGLRQKVRRGQVPTRGKDEKGRVLYDRRDVLHALHMATLKGA